MIRKLRWKFSAIMMIIVGLLLAVIFITLYCTTKANYVRRSMDTLHSAMMEDYYSIAKIIMNRRCFFIVVGA